MVGVVLCGGQSSRMGTDKGLMRKQNIPWAVGACHLLTSVAITPVVLSINALQQTSYEAFFLPNQLVVDAANLAIGGPLRGLLTVHQQFPNEAILLFACDMPLVGEAILEHLIRAHHHHPSKSVIVFENEERLEPLCAIYLPEILRSILLKYHQNQLHKHSMQYVIAQADALAIPLPAAWKSCFANFNSPTDLSSYKM